MPPTTVTAPGPLRLALGMAAFALALGLLHVVAEPAAAAPTCFGQRATLTDRDASGGIVRGTDRRDVVAVTDPHTAVFAGAGDDLVCGSAWVLGGEGDDRILLGRRSELVADLNGGPGQDRIVVTTGQMAEVHGGDGADVLLASTGRQFLLGGAGPDHLSGGRGADLLRGGPGDDLLLGGSGADDLRGHAGVDEARGGEGRDACGAEVRRGCEAP